MLNFLKKLFQKEKKSEVLNFNSLDELEKWISEQANPLIEKSRQELRYLVDEFNEKKNKIYTDLEILKNMQLLNPNISIREKQFMEGNREFYVNAITNWLKNINLAVNEIEIDKKIIENFEGMLDGLNKSTVRSYIILQEFFSHESENIARGIKGLSESIKKIKVLLENERILSLDLLKSKINEAKSKILQREKLSRLMKEAELKLESAENHRDELLKNIEVIKHSEGYINYLNSESELKNLQRDIDSYNNQLLQSFSVIKRAMMKYSHIAFEHEKLILKYIAEPLRTLSEDNNLVIIEILKKIEKLIQDDRLSLDGTKKIRTLEELKRIDRRFLMKYIDDYQRTMRKINEKIKEKEKMDITPRINELNARLSNSEMIIKNIENERIRIRSSIEKIDVDSHLKLLEESVFSFSNRTVSLKIW